MLPPCTTLCLPRSSTAGRHGLRVFNAALKPALSLSSLHPHQAALLNSSSLSAVTMIFFLTFLKCLFSFRDVQPALPFHLISPTS